ncbi:uncharacterized protein LOC130794214 [Actinidia eriantha]|uniref:uncharacterized protein LOC130794214 n=1 Tax=Actinidia eriantha TaxID=165200 RepID=UPI0025827602|nr:uncharacterized protein LOC130794214 [Actinidia eriantha]
MDFKHFSHPHNLSFHQMPPGTETLCSGCNLAGLSNVYMCWQCQFFLHDQCFLAIRSITDPSHPSHPLSLLPSPTYPSGSFFCNSCTLVGTGFSYSCSHCDFDLHLHCANHVPQPPNHVPTHHPIPNLNYSPSHNHPQIPNLNSQIPTTHHHVMNRPNTAVDTNGVKHFSHRHPLHHSQLLAVDNINCSGCEKKISGSAYRCVEPGCKFTLHMACFGLPKELKHDSHPAHPLSLLLSPAYKEHGTFTCDACLSIGTAFSYHCSACQFDLHTNCAFLPETVRRVDHSHPLTLIYSLPFLKEDQLPKDTDATCDVCWAWSMCEKIGSICARSVILERMWIV